MTHPDFTVALHIGAHKTATSHLQRSLMTQRAALAAQGVTYLGPNVLRKPGQSIPALCGMKGGFDPMIADLRRQGGHLVMSEENFIGVLNAPSKRALARRYPDAAPRIADLAAALGRDVDVFLGIRRPTAFLNSAYCQQLMGGNLVSMAEYRALHPLERVDWADLVARLRKGRGIGRVVVWRYEDYATLFPTICAQMLGEGPGALVPPLAQRIHTSLTATAVAEVLHRANSGDTGPTMTDARRLLSAEMGFPRFDGFTAAEHQASEAAYTDQVARIAATPGVTLLRPSGVEIHAAKP
jgi:hypothetical protein